jgi:7-keto-8-aminopelargonate synthetase-like enzyme
MAGVHRMPGRRELIEWLRFTCPGFVFSAGMPPQVAAAALTAVELAEGEPWRVARLRVNAQQLRTRLQMDADPVPIIPIITGSTESAVAMSQRLRAQGILAAPMIPPAVAEGTARVRLFITASHTPEQMAAVERALRGERPDPQ